MKKNPTEISTIATRVVLTEKAPFWIELLGDNDIRFLVKQCVSEDELINIPRKNINIKNINISELYVIANGIQQSTLMYKKWCIKIRK